MVYKEKTKEELISELEILQARKLNGCLACEKQRQKRIVYIKAALREHDKRTHLKNKHTCKNLEE